MSLGKQRFTVRGTGLFPFDMLRYDSCWPFTEQDSATIERTTRRRSGGRSGVCEVKLLSANHPGSPTPTHKRWESFGWKVVS